MPSTSTSSSRQPVTPAPRGANVSPLGRITDVRALLFHPLVALGDGPASVPRTSADAVLDVLVGVLASFEKAGWPSTCMIHINRAAFTRTVGWVSPDGNPDSRHYKQFAAAIEYLASTDFGEAARALHGDTFWHGPLRLLDPSSTEKPSGQLGAAALWGVRLTPQFDVYRQMPAACVQYDASIYPRLPRGTPRALFRYLAGVASVSECTTLQVREDDVLAAIGSRQQGLGPSRAEGALGKANAVLAARDAIVALPVRTGSRGVYELTYQLGRGWDQSEFLLRSALDFGAKPRSHVKEWLASDSERLAAVLAAAITGGLIPTQNVGAMLRFYMSHPEHELDGDALPHFDSGLGRSAPDMTRPHAEFLRLQFEMATKWLKKHADAAGAYRERHRRAGRPDWVTEGLVLLEARINAGALTETEWKARKRG